MTTTSEWGRGQVSGRNTKDNGLKGFNVGEIRKVGENKNNNREVDTFGFSDTKNINNKGIVDKSVPSLNKEILDIIINNILNSNNTIGQQEKISIADCNYLIKASILSDKYIQAGGQAFALLLVKKGFNKTVNKKIVENGIKIINQFKNGKDIIGSFGKLNGKIKLRWDGERVRFNVL